MRLVIAAALGLTAACAIGQRVPITSPDPADPRSPVAPVMTLGADETTAEAVAAPAPSGAVETAPYGYVCPMHREVRSPGPGRCPRCGMALKPAKEPVR